jgi:hypothetical protein
VPRPSDSNESRNAITLVHMRKVVGIAGLCYTRYGKLAGVCVAQGSILGFRFMYISSAYFMVFFRIWEL